MKLERHPGNDLPEKKVLSLAKKYFTIPMDKRDYYPRPPETIEEEAAAKAREEDESVTLAEIRNKAKRHKAVLPQDVKPHKILADHDKKKKAKSEKAKPGRPKGRKIDGNAPSILSLFKFTPRNETPEPAVEHNA